MRAAARAIAAAGPHALVLLAGDSSVIEGQSGATIVRVTDVLQPELARDAQVWVEAMARTIVSEDARDLFPVHDGVHLGDLALLEVQGVLAIFAVLAAAMVSLLEGRRVAECTVFAGDRERASALAQLASSYCPRATPRSASLLPAAHWIGDAIHAGRAALQPLQRLTRSSPASPSALPPARVLAVSETLPMAQMFAAVEEKLRSLQAGPLVRLQHGRASAITRVGDTIVVTTPSLVPTDSRRRFHFARQWHRAARRAAAFEVTAPFGRGRLRPPLFRLLQRLYRGHFDELADQLVFARRIFAEVRPELLLVGNDRWWVGHAFVLVARQLGIPSLLLLDGMTSDEAVWWWASSDRVAAWGAQWATQLQRHGMPRDRVRITGQPRYDPLAAGRTAERLVDARRVLGIQGTEPLVLVVIQQEHTTRVVTDVVDAILQVANARVLLRPRPGIPCDACTSLTAHHGDRVLVCAETPILTLLHASDIVVTEYSTVGLEAAILGLPLVTFSFRQRPSPLSYERLGLAEDARTPEELTAAIERAMQVSSGGDVHLMARRNSVEEICGPVDGHASDRVASCIMEMLQAE